MSQRNFFYIGTTLVIIFIYIIVGTVFFSSAGKVSPIKSTPVVSPTNTALSPLDQTTKIAKQGIPLTAAEQMTRTTLIASADKFGYIHTESSFSVVYLKSYDAFQIRLLSTDLNAAKQQALSWLGNQGFSHNGICKLPVVFYTNPQQQAKKLIKLDQNYCL